MPKDEEHIRPSSNNGSFDDDHESLLLTITNTNSGASEPSSPKNQSQKKRRRVRHQHSITATTVSDDTNSLLVDERQKDLNHDVDDGELLDHEDSISNTNTSLDSNVLSALTLASCIGISIKSLHHQQQRDSTATTAAATSESNDMLGIVVSLLIYALFAGWLDYYHPTTHRTDGLALTGWLLILVVLLWPGNNLLFDTLYMMYSLIVNSPVIADTTFSLSQRMAYMASGQAVNVCATLTIGWCFRYEQQQHQYGQKLLLVVASVALLRAQAMVVDNNNNPQRNKHQATLLLFPLYHHHHHPHHITATQSFLSWIRTFLQTVTSSRNVWIWLVTELLLEVQLHLYRPPTSLSHLQLSTLGVHGLLIVILQGRYQHVYTAVFCTGALVSLWSSAFGNNNNTASWFGWPLCAVQWAGYPYVMADLAWESSSSSSTATSPHCAASLVGWTKLSCRLGAAAIVRLLLHHHHDNNDGQQQHHHVLLFLSFVLQLVVWQQYDAPQRRRRQQQTTKIVERSHKHHHHHHGNGVSVL